MVMGKIIDERGWPKNLIIDDEGGVFLNEKTQKQLDRIEKKLQAEEEEGVMLYQVTTKSIELRADNEPMIAPDGFKVVIESDNGVFTVKYYGVKGC